MAQGLGLNESTSFHCTEELNFQAAVLNSIGEAVIATDISGKVLYWNKTAEKIYGWTQEEAIGRSVVELMTPEESIAQAIEIMSALREGQIWSGEFKVRHKDGHIFPAHVTDTCLKNANDEPAVIVGVSYDLSERKALEQQRQVLQEEVHRQATAIAAAEKERSEAESRFKSEFIAHMSHEIRTPLSAIKGYAELLASSVGKQQDRFWAQTIIRASQQLEELVNDVLDLSKIEAGKLRVEKEFISLRDFIAEISSLFILKAQDKGLELTLEADSQAPNWIHTDPLRLKQILINLIGNALKFTDQGYIRVRFTSYPSTSVEGTRDLIVQVQDSGIGIPLEEQEAIFEAFHQAADAQQKRPRDGTGLGLSLSRALARQLGGELQLLQSTPTQGSTFLLRLSSAESPESRFARPQLPPKVPLSLVNNAEHEQERKKILVVEDSDDVRALMEFVLSAHNAEVSTASNGQSCLEKVRAEAQSETGCFDLITMDLEMPVLNGYQALRKLREEGYQMPIVAVSARVFPGEKERCLALGFTDYLSKPLDIQKLLSLLKVSHSQDSFGYS